MMRKIWNKKRCLEKCRAPHSWRTSPNKRDAVRQRPLHKHSLTLCPAWHPNFFMLLKFEFVHWKVDIFEMVLIQTFSHSPVQSFLGALRGCENSRSPLRFVAYGSWTCSIIGWRWCFGSRWTPKDFVACFFFPVIFESNFPLQTPKPEHDPNQNTVFCGRYELVRCSLGLLQSDFLASLDTITIHLFWPSSFLMIVTISVSFTLFSLAKSWRFSDTS